MLDIEHTPNFRFLESPRSSKTFNEAYRPSYMRAMPFFAGLTTSIIIEKLKEKKFKFSQVHTLLHKVTNIYS